MVYCQISDAAKIQKRKWRVGLVAICEASQRSALILSITNSNELRLAPEMQQKIRCGPRLQDICAHRDLSVYFPTLTFKELDKAQCQKSTENSNYVVF